MESRAFLSFKLNPLSQREIFTVVDGAVKQTRVRKIVTKRVSSTRCLKLSVLKREWLSTKQLAFTG